MNKLFLILLMSIGLLFCRSAKSSKSSLQNIPTVFLGDFEDDYGSRYHISDSVWIQDARIRYHLLKYDSAGNYFIARNDAANPSEAGLYSRIDIMHFTGMSPWEWGYCLTVYKASSFQEAETTAAADRGNPRKGCGGFPFSRMKKRQ